MSNITTGQMFAEWQGMNEKLQQINQQQSQILNRFDGNTTEYYGRSGQSKPSGNIKVGSTFFEIDTSTAFMWDGSRWVVI